MSTQEEPIIEKVRESAKQTMKQETEKLCGVRKGCLGCSARIAAKQLETYMHTIPTLSVWNLRIAIDGPMKQ